MKIAALVARILLGLMFLVFGVLGFLPSMANQPLPPGVAGQFSGALRDSHYSLIVSGLMVITGALFLINRYVPLALTLIGPVIVNILLFHLLMAPASILPGAVATALWFVVFYVHRAAFSGIFAAKA